MHKRGHLYYFSMIYINYNPDSWYIEHFHHIKYGNINKKIRSVSAYLDTRNKEKHLSSRRKIIYALFFDLASIAWRY